MNVEEPDELAKNTLTQLVESLDVIRGFPMDALGIDLFSESGDLLVFSDPKPAMNHRLVHFHMELKPIDMGAIPKGLISAQKRASKMKGAFGDLGMSKVSPCH